MPPSAPADYAAALAYIRDLGRAGIDLGLERVRAVAARMGNPQDSFRGILVAGTNGKGSTSAMLASILEQAGYRTGFYSSPHLVRETERIRVQGKDISPEDFSRSAAAVYEACAEEAARRPLGRPLLTAFEFLTLLAFDAFAKAKVEAAVIEVGLGGRLDATNIVEPLASVITPIGYDHQEYLGNTLEEIAREKAGISRPGVPLISGSRRPEARRVLLACHREQGAPLWQAGTDFDFMPLRDRHMHYAGKNRTWRDLTVGLSGIHQLANASVACAAVEALLEGGKLQITDEAIREGLARVRWRGRLETLSTSPLVLADGAHNVDGARVLRRYLEQYVPFRKIHLVLGQRPDKDAEGFLAVVAPIAARITLTQTSDGSLRPPESLLPTASKLHGNVVVEPDFERILRQVYWRKPADEMAVVAGSLYLVGEALSLLESGRIEGYEPAQIKSL
ncbi:MAG: folylpolyglutamate synthase/dihydrofolate synthase family protein [Bdellovibrionota bacterium]